MNNTLLRASHPQQALLARLERMIHHGKGLPYEAAFGVNGMARRQQRASHVLAMMARWRSRLKKVQTRPVIEVGHRGRVSPAFLTHFSMVVFIAFCLERRRQGRRIHGSSDCTAMKVLGDRDDV